MRAILLFGMTLVLGLSACKTSRDIQKDKGSNQALDPNEIKTLDAPPASEVSQGGDNNAVGARASVQDLQMKLAVAVGEIENLRYQLRQQSLNNEEGSRAIREENQRLKEALNQLQQRAQVVVPQKNSKKSGNVVESLWKQGISLIKSGKDDEALVAMNTIVESYPKSKRVWGATLTAGMIQYRMKNFKEAALRFNEAIDLTAKRSRGVSLPWYFQGMTFYQLGKKEDAELFWGELERKYPGAQVSKQLAALKRRKNMRLPADPFSDVSNWEVFAN